MAFAITLATVDTLFGCLTYEFGRFVGTRNTAWLKFNAVTSPVNTNAAMRVKIFGVAASADHFAISSSFIIPFCVAQPASQLKTRSLSEYGHWL